MDDWEYNDYSIDTFVPNYEPEDEAYIPDTEGLSPKEIDKSWSWNQV